MPPPDLTRNSPPETDPLGTRPSNAASDYTQKVAHQTPHPSTPSANPPCIVHLSRRTHTRSPPVPSRSARRALSAAAKAPAQPLSNNFAPPTDTADRASAT